MTPDTQMQTKRKRPGFTLIELVVVVLVLGIIAAVAAPKMFDTADSARDNSTSQSLAVIRDAIEMYKSQNGTYPGQTGSGTALGDDLKPYIKGPFPKAQVTGAPGDASVTYETDGGGIDGAGMPDGATDWAYDNSDGTIIINVSGYETY